VKFVPRHSLKSVIL